MRKFLVLTIFIPFFAACISDDEPYFVNSKEGNFDALWHIIDTRYCFLDYKNIDWNAVREEYRPRLAQVDNKYELFDLLAEMLAELKDGHVNLLSEFDRSRYWKWYTDYPANFNSQIIFSQKYLGQDYRIAGGLRYAKIADQKIGYIYYSSFSDSFSGANIASVFQQFKDCSGIIIDVRNNGGGALTYAETLASYFFENNCTTGYICHKTGDGHSDFSDLLPVITKGNSRWQRKVAVLTNRMSYSATNDFVCRMQYAPHSLIIGDRTGGGGGLPFSSELPIGWSIRFSASPMFDRDKNQIEDGIDPDIKVDMDITDNHNDAIIDRAVEELLK
ncbi:MAG: S41 family peptidase [Prevotellaceae bacterium]|jgi:C-terminal processing protease CtpA/Prc|nr:S41 family peptidase [Prevotellaceae bacterium]